MKTNNYWKYLSDTYKKEKGREATLIGKKKSLFEVNSFLFSPTDVYLDLMKSYLKKETLTKLREISDHAIKKMEKQIEALSNESPLSDEYGIDVIKEIMRNFYANKLISNYLSSLTLHDIDAWTTDWIWNEFVMPFALINEATDERQKAINFILELKRQSEGLPSLSSKTDKQKLIERIRSAKSKVTEINPNKKRIKSEVAKALGYNSPNTFYDHLKKHNIDFDNL